MPVTAVTSSTNLLKIIRDNKLVEEDRLQSCLRSLPPHIVSGDEALAIGDALVEHGLLSRFQANLLLQGKSKSLRITSKYRLLDRLGAGGMGLVYLCEHIRMKRLVALKVLPNSQSKEPGNLERFYREAQAVAALKHPNIVQAYDVDTDNGIHYLVMEYIDGINLEKLVTTHGPLSPARACHYIAQAADGLQHAGERGLVHRDIKPSNLLIDREGYIKILDMGLARFFGGGADDLTARFDNNSVMGTADFIAPEQALNSHDVDIRADIYSLGCTFYYLLAGQPPFHELNATQKLLMHQSHDPVPVEEWRDDLDPGIAEVVRKMMAKRPDDRYQTPAEVVGALSLWTEEAIDPPTEIPGKPQCEPAGRPIGPVTTIVNQGTVPQPPSSRLQAPKPSRGMVTERITESAVRRMDGIRSRDEEGALSRRRLLVAGSLLVVALGGLIFVATKPWQPAAAPSITKQDGEDEPPVQAKAPAPKATEKKSPAPAARPQSPASGIVFVRLEPKAARPALLNGDLRAHPTDVLVFSGSDLGKATKEDAPIVSALRRQVTAAQTPILPFGLGTDGPSKVPNTLVTVNGSGIRPLRHGDRADFTPTDDFTDLKLEDNVLLRGPASLPPGVTAINSLTALPVEVTAPPEGSSLRLNSGVLLISGTLAKTATFGGGKNTLTLDFNCRTGYVTLASDADFSRPAREYVLRARLANFGNEPLVLSGTGGAILRLDSPANAAQGLVIQGATFAVKDRLFRVNFVGNAGLGTPGAPLTLNDAALWYNGAGTAIVDRSLTLHKTGQLASANAKGAIVLQGRVTGSKLSIAGTGHVVLARRDNDFNGLDVTSGTLVLNADDDGTPAGTGTVTVHSTGTLAGSGTLVKDLTVKGGVLQPGGEDGRSLVCSGKIHLERVAVKSAKQGDRLPTIRYRLVNAAAKPLVYEKNAPLDLAGANLQVSLAGGFVPDKATRCVLIANRSGHRVVNHFADAPQFASVKTQDGKWAARVTYDGDAEKSLIHGGLDVMLYDFAPVP